jgi:hypothetical protein
MPARRVENSRIEGGPVLRSLTRRGLRTLGPLGARLVGTAPIDGTPLKAGARLEEGGHSPAGARGGAAWARSLPAPVGLPGRAARRGSGHPRRFCASAALRPSVGEQPANTLHEFCSQLHELCTTFPVSFRHCTVNRGPKRTALNQHFIIFSVGLAGGRDRD